MDLLHKFQTLVSEEDSNRNKIKNLFSIDFIDFTCFNFAIKSSKSASVLHAKACKDKTIKSNSIINYFLTKASEGSRPENFILFTRSQ